MHALLGAGDLDAAADRVDPHLLVLALRVEGQVGHLLVVVDREDEVGGVTRGATGVGQRALVDLEDVPPSVVGEMFDHRVAYDPGADDDHIGAGGEVAHGLLLVGENGAAEASRPGVRLVPRCGTGGLRPTTLPSRVRPGHRDQCLEKGW